MRFIGKCFLIFFLGIAAFALFRAINDDKKSPFTGTTEGPQLSEEPDQKPENVSAFKLFADYQANEVAADNVYKGHRLAVHGLVESINKDVFDKIYMSLGTPNEFMSVQAHLAEGSAKQAANLQRGQSITVICTGDGLLVASPMLQDCSFAVPEVKPPQTVIESTQPTTSPERPAGSEPVANQPNAPDSALPSEQAPQKPDSATQPEQASQD